MSSQMSSQFQMLFVAHEQNAPNLAESRDDQLVLFNGLVVGAAGLEPATLGLEIHPCPARPYARRCSALQYQRDSGLRICTPARKHALERKTNCHHNCHRRATLKPLKQAGVPECCHPRDGEGINAACGTCSCEAALLCAIA